jgi:hypothetical protein
VDPAEEWAEDAAWDEAWENVEDFRADWLDIIEFQIRARPCGISRKPVMRSFCGKTTTFSTGHETRLLV